MRSNQLVRLCELVRDKNESNVASDPPSVESCPQWPCSGSWIADFTIAPWSFPHREIKHVSRFGQRGMSNLPPRSSGQYVVETSDVEALTGVGTLRIVSKLKVHINRSWLEVGPTGESLDSRSQEESSSFIVQQLLEKELRVRDRRLKFWI